MVLQASKTSVAQTHRRSFAASKFSELYGQLLMVGGGFINGLWILNLIESVDNPSDWVHIVTTSTGYLQTEGAI
jgi:hypothetical protein